MKNTISKKKCDWSFFDFTGSYIPVGEKTELDEKFQECNNRGERFEVFIEYLLQNIPFFNDYSWERTQETHDGKKDFEGKKNGNVEIWGECKNYTSPISVNVISPTLVMSVIEGINTVYIFSLNKVNRTFKSYINRFSETANRKVILFEDECLENIVAKNLEYLPEIKKFVKGIENLVKTPEAFSVETTPLNLYFKEIKSDKKNSPRLSLNERFIIEVTIHNQLPKSHNVQICAYRNTYFMFDGSNISNKEIKNNKYILKLPVDGGEIKTVFLYYRLSKIPKNFTALLPTVECFNEQEQTDILISRFHNKKVNINRFYHVPLLQDSLQIKNDLLKSIQNGSGIRTLIVGGSGTGKSRLLNELYSDLLCLKQKDRKKHSNIVYIDADSNNSRSKILKQMLFGFAGLSQDDGIIDSPLDWDSNNMDADLECIFQIINLDENNIKSLKSTIIGIFNNLFNNNQSSVLFFDNLQFADKFVVSIIKELKCDYVYTVNSDYINDDLQSLIQEIQGHRNPIELTSRDKNFVIEYLLNTFDNRIQDVDLLFDEDRHYTPLFLYHYVQYLMEEGIIALIDDKYIVADSLRLYNCKSNLTQEKEIIQKRIEFLLQDVNAEIQTALTLLSVMGSIPVEYIFSGLESAFETLVKHNVAKIEAKNYVLTHHTIALVFRQIFLNEFIWRECFTWLSNIDNDLFDYIKFIACFNSISIDKQRAELIFSKFFSKKLYYLTDKQNFELIFESVEKSINYYISKNELSLDKIEKIIKYYLWYSLSIQDVYGFDWNLSSNDAEEDNNLKIVNRILSVFFSKCFPDAELNNLMYEIFREYFNRLLVKGMYNQLEQYSNKLIDIVHNEIDSDDKYFWLSMCYNRQSIALSAINGNNEENAYKYAMLYAEKDTKSRNLANIYYDDGYRFYNDYTCYNKALVIERFKKAIEIKKERRTCIEDYQEALVLLLENRIEESYNLVVDCLQDNKNIYDYYLCKMSILRAYLDIILFNMNKQSSKKVWQDIKEAERIVSTKSAREMQFHIFFLKGKYSELFNKEDKSIASLNYCNAVKSYCSTHTNIEQRKKFTPFYYAIILKLSKLHFENWSEITETDPIAKEIVEEFLEKNNQVDYIVNLPQGIIVDPTTKETYPSL